MKLTLNRVVETILILRLLNSGYTRKQIAGASKLSVSSVNRRIREVGMYRLA